MCIKIIGPECEKEFDGTEPLENQVAGAEKIVVSYDPLDIRICSFEGQLELMAKNGIDCSAEIEVKSNDYLEGMKLERRLAKLKKCLNTNVVIKELTKFHASADRKLNELADMCLGRNDER